MSALSAPVATGIAHAVVLSAVPVPTKLRRYLQGDDYIVACDAGYRNAQRLGVVPDLIVGDFDSAPQPQTLPDHTIVLPHVKDDTDTHYAARWLLEHGCRQVTFLGALGGARLEHTVANLHTALFLAKNGVKVLLADANSELRILCPNKPMTLLKGDWAYLSLFPLDGVLTASVKPGCFILCETRPSRRIILLASAMNS